MAKSKSKPKSKPKTPDADVKVICRNRRASHEYELLETLECGIVLVGTEVKSLRDGKGMLEDAYAKLDGGELWLLGCEIPEYAMGTHANHKPKRARKLLVHRREIDKMAGKATAQGFTLVPTRLYFKAGRAKVEIAVAKGKQLHDKREAKKKADAKREMDRAINRYKR